MEIGNFVTGFEGILENYGKSQLKKNVDKMFINLWLVVTFRYCVKVLTS